MTYFCRTFVPVLISRDNLKKMVIQIVLFSLCFVFASSSCPHGWAEFDGECLFFGRTPHTWVDSEAACRKMNAYLASDDNPKKHEFIKSFLNVFTSWGARTFWLGGNDYVIEGQWRWVETGTAMTGFSIWGPDYPKGGLGTSCLATYFNGTELFWQDASCGHAGHHSHGYNYICEKPADTDGSVVIG